MLAHGPQILTKAGTTARAAIRGLGIACDLPERPGTTTPTGLDAMRQARGPAHRTAWIRSGVGQPDLDLAVAYPGEVGGLRRGGGAV